MRDLNQFTFHPKWKDATKVLPTKSHGFSDNILVYCEDGYFSNTAYSTKYGKFNVSDLNEDASGAFEDVTHWANIPSHTFKGWGSMADFAECQDQLGGDLRLHIEITLYYDESKTLVRFRDTVPVCRLKDSGMRQFTKLKYYRWCIIAPPKGATK